MKLSTIQTVVAALAVAASLSFGTATYAGKWTEETRIDELSHRSADHIVLPLERRGLDDPRAIAVNCVRGEESLVIYTGSYRGDTSNIVTIMTDGRPHKLRGKTSGSGNTLYAVPDRELLRDLAKADDIVVGFKDRRGQVRSGKSENTRRGVLLTAFTAGCR